ncbi:unnamed protein product [Phyllotreta striolata]|uniref:PDZ domain-containing protein n=1 Tax=Phyllotreta striolata TaxID=444603 RepID=A0A9N9TRA6_PHYSR|nr:unnamed protein product [Phyllotreta striolata]
MVLSTEWSQVEVIDLVNDGSGLGFGIVGGRSTGVVIKSILPGGIADKDSRLQSGDHILQIGDVNLRGLTADQVATVLRQAGQQVRMVVARSVEPTSQDFLLYSCSAPVVPTKILTDPEELDRQLLQNGYTSSFYQYAEALQVVKTETSQQSQVENLNSINLSTLNGKSPATSGKVTPNGISPVEPQPTKQLIVDIECIDNEPETEKYKVKLIKDENGLGITIAGYVCEKESLCGIFVKSLNEQSYAYKCGKIQINDRIIEVDGVSLENCTNYEAVKRLKETNREVDITFERYLSGPKYEQLQEAIADREKNNEISPASPSVTTLSWIPIDNTDEQDNAENTSLNSNSILFDQNTDSKEIFIDENFEVNLADDLETATKEKWQGIIGDCANIVVANLVKLKGIQRLGISLEGTVDVEGGIELRPHHYIRSILPEGPVGQNGKLNPGDELLEVNGQKLLGIRHVEVVKILKELPNAVRIVCARENKTNRVINTSQDREAFEARNILGGSLKNLLPQPEQKLIKALSDTSLNTSSTITDESNLQKAKSRSLEVTNVAMWSDEVEYVELMKGDRGLGFSILDYQDPIDLKSSVIVVRSLVPNGPAEQNGKITPGDRLISVNGKIIRNATLDQAVQALKGTPQGVVKLGIAKPLSSTRTSETMSNQTDRS